MTVRGARSSLTRSLGRAYRDPGRAAERLALLEQELGSAASAAAHLAGRPTLLGRLRGSGWFFAVDGAVDRHFALKAAGEVGQKLVAQRKEEQQAARVYREPIERRRHVEAVEVPDLSRQARQAVEAVWAVGAAADWIDPPPWDPRPPSADEIANAARVAPVWEAIRAKPALHGELTRFMHAADQRLPCYRDQRCEGLHSPERAAQTMSGILHAAEALHLCHPSFQAYAAEEPKRQAQDAREQEAAARAAEQARRTVEEKAQADAKATAETDARIAAALAHRHQAGPRFSPGMG